MVRLQLTQSGGIVYVDEDVARQWVATGFATLAPVVETTSRTAVPVPARLRNVESR